MSHLPIAQAFYATPAQSAATQLDVKPVQDTNGFWYFPELPQCAVVATEEELAAIKTGTPFILHGFYSEKYECYRATKNFKRSDYQAWIDEGRFYLLNVIAK